MDNWMPIEENPSLLKLLEPPKASVASFVSLNDRCLLPFQSNMLHQSMLWIQTKGRVKWLDLLCWL